MLGFPERGFRMPLLGPHQELHPLYFQFSPEFQACTASSLLLWRGWRGSCLLGRFLWGLGDFFLLPILSTAGQDTQRMRRCLGNACMYSFKAKCGAPPMPGPGLDGVVDIVVRPTSGPVFKGCGSNGVQTHHQTVTAQSSQGWDGGSSEVHGNPEEETPLHLSRGIKVGFQEKEMGEPTWEGGGRLRPSMGKGAAGGGNGW